MQESNICLFLDRDGTVNEERNFLKDPNDLQLIPGAARVIREAQDLGLKVIIVSNQSGIARGILTENDVQKVNERLTELLSNENARVDAIYYCPHDAIENNGCTCRKPKSGMFEVAKREHNIDLNRSIMVGDRMSDIEAGNRIGARTILVLTGYGAMNQKDIERESVKIDLVVPSLFDGMSFIRDQVNIWRKHEEGREEIK